MTNQNVELKGAGNRASLCLDAALTAHLVPEKRRTDPVGAGTSPPGASVPSAHTQNSHSPDPCDATPVQLQELQWLPPRPLPPHTCVPMPSLCLRADPELSRAGRAEKHSDLVSRTPTGPGASAGLRKCGRRAGTQQLPPSQLLLGIRPTQLPGLGGLTSVSLLVAWLQASPSHR